MMSVVQNFICTKESRLNVIRDQVPKMSKIFKDFDFYINYATVENYFEVSSVYNDNVKKLNFFNDPAPIWSETTLDMVIKINTPYTLILCEDFEYRTTYDEWKNILNEVVERDVNYMPIGRLWKYTKEMYHQGYDEGDNLWLYPASKSPGSSLSVDALYKTEFLLNRLIDLKEYASDSFPLNLPHHYEDIYHEKFNNGVRKWGNDFLCAVPKKIILMHTQSDTETILNKGRGWQR